MLSRISPWWLWCVLAVPAAKIAMDLATSTNPRIYHILVHPSGEWSVRFLIIALSATPLASLLRGWRGPRWLIAHRRYFGVSAFGYAFLHLAFYLVDKGTLERVLGQATRLDIATGWLAFAIFLPLAATSTDAAVRLLGPWWKPVQRCAYVAGVLALVHWASLDNWSHLAGPIVHFSPLAALMAYRIWRSWDQSRTPGAIRT